MTEMIKIIVFGAMGVGDTTLGRELAKRLKCCHFDIDDYIWRWDTEIPYTKFYSCEERIENMKRDISKHQSFVMSGSMWSIRKEFESLFNLAVFMTAPAEIRAERLRLREFANWGSRVLSGGDIYEANELHRDYLAAARKYETNDFQFSSRKQHEQWAEELPCPVLQIDGTKSIDENAKLVLDKILKEN